MTSETEAARNGISRRKFLKILGQASAVGAVGCAKDHEQKVYSRVKSDDAHVPGIPVWYSSTCTECTANCGFKVKNYDGRVIKVEGDKEHPISRGGLCALGQASLQSLYDPDRVRQPLKKSFDKNNKPFFVPISWEDAYTQIKDSLGTKGKRNLFITGEYTGSRQRLIEEFSRSFDGDWVSYDPTQPVALARAWELTTGTYGIPQYLFEKADAIVNFGADFLETWVSPVEFASRWATKRRSGTPQQFIQIEPRLSLTGANADLWISNSPGSDVGVALIVLREVFRARGGRGLSEGTKRGIEKLTSDLDLHSIAKNSGVSIEKILLPATTLTQSKSSIVLAGGSSSATVDPLPLFVVTCLINLVLGNTEETISFARVRTPRSSLSQVQKAVENLNSEKVQVLFVDGSNPFFTVPSSFGLPYAARKASLVVSLSSYLDETSQAADLILPSHSGLEMWGVVEPMKGVWSIVQPAMAPVFDTKDFTDIILEITSLSGASSPKAEGANTAVDYAKSYWKQVHNEHGSGRTLDDFWRTSVERGGYFQEAPAIKAPGGDVSGAVFAMEYGIQPIHGDHGKKSALVLYPFFSVKSFDGRAANRPWLQELPDPITQIVWDSWVEIHPDTAKALDIHQAEPVTIRNYNGEINVPAYVTNTVAPGVVAVPVGQGHKAYGRFAKAVGGGNVMELLPNTPGKDVGSVPLVSSGVEVFRGAGKHDLVILSGSKSQHDRQLARTKVLAGSALAATHNAHSEGAHGEGHGDSHGASHGKEEGGHANSHGHHEPKGFAQHPSSRADNTQVDGPKQMYLQREHPIHQWGMSIDLASCTGCSACVVACYAENNIPVVGKEMCHQGREMSWLRIERYFDPVRSDHDGGSHHGEEGEEFRVSFLPMLCQHCNNAPCEPVCPVYATYHNDEGMNVMVYNRCVGTRYCSNNCSYKVRRFNWVDIEFPSPLDWQLNPDVTKRSMGVMEKCTFCVQRITEAKDHAKDEGRLVRDGEVQPACVQSCPTQAIVFGDLNDPQSKVREIQFSDRSYKILDHHINTQPAVSYLEDVKIKI